MTGCCERLRGDTVLDNASLKDLLSKSGDACREPGSCKAFPDDVEDERPAGKVTKAELCLRYINAEPDAEAIAVQRAQRELQHGIERLIKRLSWNDFELLTDLVLTGSGWRRITPLGGLMKDVDLIVEQPLAGTRRRSKLSLSWTAMRSPIMMIG